MIFYISDISLQGLLTSLVSFCSSLILLSRGHDSKAFDCLNHDLLIAKLNAYGFSLPALRLIHDYLLNRKQRTRINNSYSTWVEIVFGVPQGSILGPLLFNIFPTDLFFIANSMDIANYADDNTPYAPANY